METGERRPELDGLRGVAIVLVLIGHAFESLAPLAAAGVTLFFALSGYLIAGLLLAEYQRRGRLDLRRFYMRRLTRLAPPLFVMLVVMGAVFDIGWRILAPMLWVTNYVPFPVEPFGHTWSLAVEEQFYLLFPLLLIGLLRARRPVAILAAVVLALAAWRMLLTATGHLDHAYSSVETAGVPILAGCLIALSGFRLPTNRAPFALAVTVGLALAAGSLHDSAWLLTPLLVTPTVVILVASCRGVRWLRWSPLGAVGVASYSLYLWHKPVAWMVDGGLTPAGVLVGAIVGLVAFYAIEAPLMRWRARDRHRPLEVPQPSQAVLLRG